jgi:hypothetical protein
MPDDFCVIRPPVCVNTAWSSLHRIASHFTLDDANDGHDAKSRSLLVGTHRTHTRLAFSHGLDHGKDARLYDRRKARPRVDDLDEVWWNMAFGRGFQKAWHHCGHFCGGALF